MFQVLQICRIIFSEFYYCYPNPKKYANIKYEFQFQLNIVWRMNVVVWCSDLNAHPIIFVNRGKFVLESIPAISLLIGGGGT